MMYLDPYADDGGGGGSGSSGSSGGYDPGITGGTDPSHPPTWRPGGNGLWTWINGAWRWVWDPISAQNKMP